jgi:hypothetical protein
MSGRKSPIEDQHRDRDDLTADPHCVPTFLIFPIILSCMMAAKYEIDPTRLCSDVR